ncbi:hypothetical protein F511_35938 [Dorcoceras hygrometricum]|uniref:Uncharacterized protein n=1 Tax=Dorcoceras hygrometricum TaxID=472368 RepID=A0A2Z7BDV7_9LAMI|nr:hypothetical protein F511_35938 [Dorcoceras hygrometricum]
MEKLQGQLCFGTVNPAVQRSTQICDSQTVNSDLGQSTQLVTVNSDLGQSTQLEMALFVPRTRAAATLRMKQITLDNHNRTIRRLRAKLATERHESATIKKGLQDKDHIQLTESTIQEQQLTIETLMEENSRLLQTIQGLKVDNVVPFDDEWEEEEGLEEIPVGEGGIVDE